MKTFFNLVVFTLFVGGWALAAASVHVVRTPGTIPVTLVTKADFGIADTYVDTTWWTLADVAKHPAVVERLIHADRADALAHVVDARKDVDVETQLADQLRHAAAETPRRSAAKKGGESWASVLGSATSLSVR